MSLPKTVNVFGQKIKVKELKLSPEYAGLFNFQKLTIYINTEQLNEVERFHTFLHEFLHSVFWRLGLNQVISHEIEELLVENIARALIDNDLTPSEKEISEAP